MVNARLDRLTVFVAVAEAGHFTSAAQRLGATKAMVSQQIARLERELETSLFIRSTRRVVLSRAGEELYRGCRPVLRELESVLERAQAAESILHGALRITCSPDYLDSALAPLLARFAAEHPGLTLDVLATDERLDMIEAGIDVAIRSGSMPDSRLRAVRLAEFEMCAVAAPAYLARAGSPQTPADLRRHEWVALSILRAPSTYRFVREGRHQTIRLRSTLRCNTPGGVRALARAGAGVAVLPRYMLESDLANGALVRVLPGWVLPRGGIYAVYANTRYTTGKVREIVSFLRAGLSGAHAAASARKTPSRRPRPIRTAAA